MTQPTSLRFVHRFCCGTRGVLTLSCGANKQPAPAQYVWSGPTPRLDKERLDWEKSCFAHFAERSGLQTHYLAFLRNGKVGGWLFKRGKKPRRVPIDDSFKTPGTAFPGSYEVAQP